MIGRSIGVSREELIQHWYEDNHIKMTPNFTEKAEIRKRIDNLKLSYMESHKNSPVPKIDLFRNGKIKHAREAAARLQLFTMWQIEKLTPNFESKKAKQLSKREDELYVALHQLINLSHILTYPRSELSKYYVDQAKQSYKQVKELFETYMDNDPKMPLKELIKKDFKALKSVHNSLKPIF